MSCGRRITLTSNILQAAAGDDDVDNVDDVDGDDDDMTKMVRSMTQMMMVMTNILTFNILQAAAGVAS